MIRIVGGAVSIKQESAQLRIAVVHGPPIVNQRGQRAPGVVRVLGDPEEQEGLASFGCHHLVQGVEDVLVGRRGPPTIMLALVIQIAIANPAVNPKEFDILCPFIIRQFCGQRGGADILVSLPAQRMAQVRKLFILKALKKVLR